MKKYAICLGAGLLIIIACFFWQLKIFQKQLADIQSDLGDIRQEKGIYQLRQQFEYRVAAPSDTSFVKDMDLWGSAGWEIVSARRATRGSGYYQEPIYEVILKRPR